MHQKLVDNTDKGYSFEELCKTYKTPKLEKQTTSEDAYNLALIFIKLKAKLRLI